MAPDLILVVAGLSAAWAVFSIVGGERERVLQRVELLRRAGESGDSESSEPAKSPAATPARKA
jgi:hypothetical protein